MKKISVLLLVSLLLVSLAACGKEKDTTAPAAASADNKTADTQTADAGKTSKSSLDGAGAVLGKLYFIEDRDQPMKKLSIAGNQLGSTEFNSKDPSTEGIRSFFEMNEWVEFTPEADKSFDVWVLTHRDDWDYYLDADFSEEMKGFANYCELYYDPDSGFDTWGALYLNPDDSDPGLYDFVFTSDDKAFAILKTRFYNETELDGKSDAELEKLMK